TALVTCRRPGAAGMEQGRRGPGADAARPAGEGWRSVDAAGEPAFASPHRAAATDLQPGLEVQGTGTNPVRHRSAQGLLTATMPAMSAAIAAYLFSLMWIRWMSMLWHVGHFLRDVGQDIQCRLEGAVLDFGDFARSAHGVDEGVAGDDVPDLVCSI